MEKQDKNYEFIGKSLWFPVEKVLVIADLHIGHEEAMNKSGIFFPRIQFSQIVFDLEKIFKYIRKRNEEIKEIIVNGDLKHEFGTISEQEWNETLNIIDLLKRNSKKVILIKGNHDKILEPIAKRGGIEVRDFYIKNDVCFMHGNKIFPECLDKKIKTIVLGHRHPAVVISDKYKKERYKCFLVGKWRGKEIIILPSFFPLVEGSDIVTVGEDNLLFIPEKNLKDFDVYAVGDEVYRFGKLKDAEDFGN